MPHPCVLFSSSPYLRYILGEKQPKVNPKTKKYHLKYNKNRTPTTQGTGRSRPPSRPGPGSSTSAQPTDTDIEEYRHKSKPSRPPQPRHSFKKSPRGVQRGRGFAAPLRFYTVVNSASKFPSISYSPASRYHPEQADLQKKSYQSLQRSSSSSVHPGPPCQQ